MSLLATTIGVIVSFSFYLGIVLPLYGEGTLWGAIGTGAAGVLLGNVAHTVSSRRRSGLSGSTGTER